MSASPTMPLVTIEEIREAHVRIRPAARVTPLLEVPYPADAPRTSETARFFVKCESLQPMGAFKIRGAYNMVAQLDAASRARGVITYSSGNHGQAVALAAQLLGAPAVIVMPTTAPLVKVEGARSYGAEVVFAGTTSTDRKLAAEALAAERGLTIIPPFDHHAIITGQGTVGLEILEQCPEADVIYVSIGGGGQATGLAAAIKQLRPSVRVVGVEPEGAPTMKTALAAGAPVSLPSTASIADGLLTIRAGDITFAHAQAFLDEVVTVPDAAIADAVAWLSRYARLVAEPSGAAATAAVRLGLGLPSDARHVVAIVSGGNVAPEALSRYVALGAGAVA
jgi:threonine dehydratase